MARGQIRYFWLSDGRQEYTRCLKKIHGILAITRASIVRFKQYILMRQSESGLFFHLELLHYLAKRKNVK